MTRCVPTRKAVASIDRIRVLNGSVSSMMSPFGTSGPWTGPRGCAFATLPTPAAMASGLSGVGSTRRAVLFGPSTYPFGTGILLPLASSRKISFAPFCIQSVEGEAGSSTPTIPCRVGSLLYISLTCGLMGLSMRLPPLSRSCRCGACFNACWYSLAIAVSSALASVHAL